MAEELNSGNNTIDTGINASENSTENQNNLENDISIQDTNVNADNENDNSNKNSNQGESNNLNDAKKENDRSEDLPNVLKRLKKETGCTSEELLELLMDIKDHKKIYEEEEEEEEAPDDDDYGEQDYGSPEYWENRYTICPETFDWYQKWDAINNELSQLFNGDELVLNIGCGNSEMSADMQKTTFQTVVSIDISGVVIEQMIEKYKDNKDLLWFEMDCTNLSFEDEFFDIVFDKGTFDAILCGQNSIKNIFLSMNEIWRVLKYGGLFIEITYGQPSHRLELFKNIKLSWKLYEPIVINNNNHEESELDDSDEREGGHYIYIFQKLLNWNEDSDDQKNNDENINDNNNDNNNNSANNNDSSIDNNNNADDSKSDEKANGHNNDENNELNEEKISKTKK